MDVPRTCGSRPEFHFTGATPGDQRDFRYRDIAADFGVFGGFTCITPKTAAAKPWRRGRERNDRAKGDKK
jgi:hypothetical protein